MAEMAETQFPLVSKIIVKGIVRCLTGLHIGAVSQQFAIGGIDSPVVKDPLTGEPYIPGSSLKGKLRSLTERALNKKLIMPERGKQFWMHWCTNRSEAEMCEVCRLFGCVPVGKAESEENKMPSSVYVRDLHLNNGEDIAKKIVSPLKYTEWKTENALDRITAAANPRDIERVPKGAEFGLELMYNVSDKNATYFAKDMETLVFSLHFLEDDCLGGHGSRGYGKVALLIDRVTARKAKYYYTRCEGSEKSEEFRDKQEKDAEKRKKALMPVSQFKEELPKLIEALIVGNFLKVDNV
jgi:CRISPR-associated protein Csm3